MKNPHPAYGGKEFAFIRVLPLKFCVSVLRFPVLKSLSCPSIPRCAFRSGGCFHCLQKQFLFYPYKCFRERQPARGRGACARWIRATSALRHSEKPND